MATAARIREAEQVAAAYHSALSQLGIQMAADTLAMWGDVPAVPGVPGWAAWVPRMLRIVILRRKAARELTEAYYRLTRALMTGTTTTNDGESPGEYTSLGKLRDDFNSIIEHNYAGAPQAGANGEGVREDTEGENVAQQPAQDAPDGDAGDEAERIILEELERLREEEIRQDREAEEAIRATLERLAKEELDRKTAQAAREAEEASQVDALRDQAHREVGMRTAAALARHAMNGGRADLYAKTYRDSRTLGYVRVSQSGSPCSFCAMLMSREVFYKTEASASFNKDSDSVSYEDGDRYHDNCMCYPMPVFDKGQYEQSDKFAKNREYREMWPKVTEGLTGDAARRAWRRYIDSARRAQAAQRNTNVQEA